MELALEFAAEIAAAEVLVMKVVRGLPGLLFCRLPCLLFERLALPLVRPSMLDAISLTKVNLAGPPDAPIEAVYFFETSSNDGEFGARPLP